MHPNVHRTTRVRRACYVTLMLLLVAPFGAAAMEATTATPTLLVPAGTVRIADGLLESAGDLVVDGEVRAASGDLVLRAVGDIIVRGRVVGAAGAPGEAGGSLLLLAGRAVLVAEGGHVRAGPGGHGESAVVPEGIARGARGGDGGRIVVEAPFTSLDGVLAPGRGGDGGHAYGVEAFGGDGGTMAGLFVNGVNTPPREFATQAEPSLPFDSLTISAMDPNCVSNGSLDPFGVMVAKGESKTNGSDGGHACARGVAGGAGGHGLKGADDKCEVCGTTNHPLCAPYGTAHDGKITKNGQGGQFGGSMGRAYAWWAAPPAFPASPEPTMGGSSKATGGRGGDATSSTAQAGHGGWAYAVGGAGGAGGNGGAGGAAGSLGAGCEGGFGGNGAPGGGAVALGGAQGLNLFDCELNGDSGAARADGGAGGVGGTGGAGGAGGGGSRDGFKGGDGKTAASGHASATVPAPLVCVPPGAPTVTTAFNHLGGAYGTCSEVRVIIKAPVSVGTFAAVTRYDIYRNLTDSTTMGMLKKGVTFSGSPQVYVDATVEANTMYTYQVQADSDLGLGGISSPATQSTTCIGPAIQGPVGTLLAAVEAPILAAVPGKGSGRVDLTITWIHATPVDSYNVYRADLGGSFNVVKNVPYVDKVTSSFDVVVGGLAYIYQVKPVRNNVEGDPSNLAPVTAPLFMSPGPITPCHPQQEVHAYVGTARIAAGVGFFSIEGLSTGWYEQGVRAAVDTCSEDGVTPHDDGEAETGVGGGRFVAGSNWAGCILEPAVSHHAYGVGATYWASDDTGIAAIVYTAGADGPSLIPDPMDPCATDGIISSNPVTDPLDCGAGSAGVYSGGSGWTPATLGENVPGSGACDPFDGNVWVSIAAGPSVGPDGVIVSTPIMGSIWSSVPEEVIPPPA